MSIPNPRPMLDENAFESKKGTKRLIMGGKSSGVVFDLTKNGIEVNGYYTGSKEGTKYANMLNPVFIPWEEFDKMRYTVKHKGKGSPDFVDNTIDEEYLSTLPIVHINNRKYYIDSDKRERRMVSNPKNVYRF